MVQVMERENEHMKIFFMLVVGYELLRISYTDIQHVELCTIFTVQYVTVALVVTGTSAVSSTDWICISASCVE